MEHFDLILQSSDQNQWVKVAFTPKRIQRWLAEKFISDYREKMNILREVDEQISAWSKELSQMTKKMRSALSSARYIDLALLLNNLNRKLLMIGDLGVRIQKFDDQIEEFEMAHEMDLPNPTMLPRKKSSSALISQAGMWEDMKRNFVRMKFDRDFRKERRLALEQIIAKAESTANKVQAYVKELNQLRAHGEIGAYIDVLNKISVEQRSFQSEFFPIYSKYLEDFVNQALAKKKQQEAQKPAEKDQSEFGYEDEPKVPTLPGSPIIPKADNIPETIDNPKNNKPASAPKGWVEFGDAWQKENWKDPNSSGSIVPYSDPPAASINSIKPISVDFDLESSKPNTTFFGNPSSFPPINKYQKPPSAPAVRSTMSVDPDTIADPPGTLALPEKTLKSPKVDVQDIQPATVKVPSLFPESGSEPISLRDSEVLSALPSVAAAIQKHKNQQFWEKYSAISENQKLTKMSLLLSYSQELENSNPVLSAKLLNFAEEMLHE